MWPIARPPAHYLYDWDSLFVFIYLRVNTDASGRSVGHKPLYIADGLLRSLKIDLSLTYDQLATGLLGRHKERWMDEVLIRKGKMSRREMGSKMLMEIVDIPSILFCCGCEVICNHVCDVLVSAHQCDVHAISESLFDKKELPHENIYVLLIR